MSISEAYASVAAYTAGSSGVAAAAMQPLQQVPTWSLQDTLGVIGAGCIVFTAWVNFYYKRRADLRAERGLREVQNADE